MRGFKGWAGLSLALALFASPALLQAQEAPEPECELQTDLTSVPVSAEPVSLIAVHSEALGEEISAAFAEESGVEVVSVEQDPDEELTLLLTLDTSAAEAGDWELAVESADSRCVAEVEVVADPELEDPQL